MISQEEKYQAIGKAASEFSNAKVALAFIDNQITEFRKVCRYAAEHDISHLSDANLKWWLSIEQITEIVKDRHTAMQLVNEKQLLLSSYGISI